MATHHRLQTVFITAGVLAALTLQAFCDPCEDCHKEENPGLYKQWKHSAHGQNEVTCLDCHGAEDADLDAFEHHDESIATLVTPKDCAACHEEEANETMNSYHAKAGEILESKDAFLAHVAGGEPVAITGCESCHGTKVQIDPGSPNKLSRKSWPNSGIGRINPDGSKGACNACHSRHSFSVAQARRPENCGKCHLGPDHPQKEIYEESKHAIAYRDLKDHMNLDAESWVLGKDYVAAPTCATCHMSGNLRNEGRITHDPGQRLSWTNRPYISLVMDTDADGEVVKETDAEKRRALVVETAEVKRNRMKNVCSHCHTADYINGFYEQYDDFVLLYNEKFGKPGKAIMTALEENGLLSPTPFDDEIEWTWFYLWHHEGRRARHGASMMAPDYAHWHGMFEVAERFYKELIPQARELIHRARSNGKTVEADAANRLIEEILSRPEHAWSVKEAERRYPNAESPGTEDVPEQPGHPA